MSEVPPTPQNARTAKVAQEKPIPKAFQQRVRKATPADVIVVNMAKLRMKNIGFAFAVILLWIAGRFLFIRLHLGTAGDFRRFDVLCIVLLPTAAFFLNWYWLREQHTDVIIKWSLGWAVGNLIGFLLIVFFAAAPLHRLLLKI